MKVGDTVILSGKEWLHLPSYGERFVIKEIDCRYTYPYNIEKQSGAINIWVNESEIYKVRA